MATISINILFLLTLLMNTKLVVVALVAGICVIGASFIFLSNAKDKAVEDDSQSIELTLNAFPETRNWIMGNANLDDKIDSKDVTYLQAVIAGTAARNDMCDANCDGKIDSKDVEQVKKIIGKTAKKIWFVDIDKQVSSCNYPVKKLISIYTVYTEAVIVLGAQDMIVGSDDDVIKRYKVQFGLDVPSIGNRFTPTREAVLKIADDNKGDLGMYFTGTRARYDSGLEKLLNPYGVDVVRLPTWEIGLAANGIITLSYLLGKEEAAFKYIAWHDSIIGKITNTVSSIKESDRKTVFLDYDYDIVARSVGSGDYENTILCGGKNISQKLGNESYPKYTIEWLTHENPDVIIRSCSSVFVGQKGCIASCMDTMNNQLKLCSGTKHVYGWEISCGPAYVISMMLYAKWLYPEKFGADFDPLVEYQHYIDKFTPWKVNVNNLEVCSSY